MMFGVVMDEDGNYSTIDLGMIVDSLGGEVNRYINTLFNLMDDATKQFVGEIHIDASDVKLDGEMSYIPKPYEGEEILCFNIGPEFSKINHKEYMSLITGCSDIESLDKVTSEVWAALKD